jgi:hypothetical protein
MQLNLIILKDTYAIYKFKGDSDITDLINDSDFYSVTKTQDELSVVSKQLDSVSDMLEVNKGWRIFKLSGPLDFSLIGIIAGISRIFKENKIPIFTISTYETDYILVKSRDLNRAIDSLKANGHEITYEN